MEEDQREETLSETQPGSKQRYVRIIDRGKGCVREIIVTRTYNRKYVCSTCYPRFIKSKNKNVAHTVIKERKSGHCSYCRQWILYIPPPMTKMERRVVSKKSKEKRTFRLVNIQVYCRTKQPRTFITAVKEIAQQFGKFKIDEINILDTGESK